MTENNEIIASRIVRKYNEGEYIFNRDDIGVLLASINELASDIAFRDNMRDQLINETGKEITRLRLLVAELKEDGERLAMNDIYFGEYGCVCIQCGSDGGRGVFWKPESVIHRDDCPILLHRSLMSKVDEVMG